MPRGHSRRKGKRLSAYSNLWYADEETQQHYKAIVAHYESASSCLRALVNAEYKRITEPESFGYAVSLKGTSPMSGQEP